MKFLSHTHTRTAFTHFYRQRRFAARELPMLAFGCAPPSWAAKPFLTATNCPSDAETLGSLQWSNVGGLVGRNRVATKMSPEPIGQAQQMARKCQESNYAHCD